ncbi:hypothetical protein OC834_003838 [Tilletia horrida]|nr:hypothetical protein OC834_003838 [Tilletia horrida]
MASSSSAASLRRRLERDGGIAGVNTSTIDESFVVLGTPLPALTSSKRDPNELKPVWEQEVRDEQGRQRFHGAFTGGFSAGYFNTVGSKEGWTPSSFKSSRKDQHGKKRAQNDGQQQRIEDFMDEEDLRELHESRELRGADAFASSASAAGPASAAAEDSSRYDPILGAFGVGPSSSPSIRGADGRIQPAPENLGAALMRKFGWKDGHGVGPRVTRRRRDELRALLMPRGSSSGTIAAGRASKPTAADEDEPSLPSSSRKLLYPPPDTPLLRPASIAVEGRGLGWTAPTGLHDALARDLPASGAGSFGMPGTKAKASNQRARGFGISVLEHDSDDEGEMGGAAVYAESDDIRQSTLVDCEGMERRHARRSGPEQGERGTRKGEGKLREAEANDEGKENTWADGRPMPSGFVRARTKQGAFVPDQIFLAPKRPKDWKPNPTAIWEKYAPPAAPTGDSSDGKAALAPQDRGQLLGELRIPGPPPVISDYLSSKARERLSAAAEADNEPSRAPLQLPIERPLEIPRLDTSVARAALQGYMPFANDAAKQERYKIYLRSQAEPRAGTAEQLSSALEEELKATVQPPASSSRSRWDVAPSISPPDRDQLRHELGEFFRSANIFRPSTAVITNRFTSAKEQSGAGGGAAVQGGLYVPSDADRAASAAAAKALAEGGAGSGAVGQVDVMAPPPVLGKNGELVVGEGEDPAAKAADAGMFGVLTRRYREWYPPKLLCKRFGVPDPHPDYTGVRYGDGESGSRGGGVGGGRDDSMEGEDRFGTGASSAGRKGGRKAHSEANALWEQNKRGIMQLAKERQWEGQGISTPGGPGGDEVGDVSSSSLAAGHGGGRGPRQPRSLETVGLGDDDETQGRDTLAYVRPPIEVFKAVFVSDDEDEDDEADAENQAGAASASASASALRPSGSTSFGSAGGANEIDPERERKRRKLVNFDAVGDISEGGGVRFVPRNPASSAALKRKAVIVDSDADADSSLLGDVSVQSQSVSFGGGKSGKKKAKKEKRRAMLTFDLDEGDAEDGAEDSFDMSTISIKAVPAPKVAPMPAPPLPTPLPPTPPPPPIESADAGGKDDPSSDPVRDPEQRMGKRQESGGPASVTAASLPARGAATMTGSRAQRARAADYF